MAEGFGEQGMLARVSRLSDDGTRVFLDFRNGNNGHFDPSPSDEDYVAGDVLLISDADEGRWKADRMPRELWPEDTWVGTVRIKLGDVSIIESNGRSRTVPTNPGVEYDEGSTVHATDHVGVVRVLSSKPLKQLDLPVIDDSAIEQFLGDGAGGSGLDFSDFGGLTDVVERARELIELPLQRNEALLAIGARPIKGVLFTGLPGTGKTHLARIIAAQVDAAFYEVSGPQIFSKWYGQSEELLRKLFAAAASHDRAIIFFDEIDSIAGKRADDSHEASKRVVAQLLTLMDGFKAEGNVVVVAATNRPDDLDFALRRPGRFDSEIEFPLPSEIDRMSILETSSRRLSTERALPYQLIASRTEGWTAAQLAAIWTEAALLAVSDDRESIMAEDLVGGFQRVAGQRGR